MRRNVWWLNITNAVGKQAVARQQFVEHSHKRSRLVDPSKACYVNTDVSSDHTCACVTCALLPWVNTDYDDVWLNSIPSTPYNSVA